MVLQRVIQRNTQNLYQLEQLQQLSNIQSFYSTKDCAKEYYQSLRFQNLYQQQSHFITQNSNITYLNSFGQQQKSQSALSNGRNIRFFKVLQQVQQVGGEQLDYKQDKAETVERFKDLNIQKEEGKDWSLNQPVYDQEYLNSDLVEPKHIKPQTVSDYLVYYMVSSMKFMFDMTVRFKPGQLNYKTTWLIRVIFLESIAGVPGMVGAMQRHMRSLTFFKMDNGWIHTQLEEAENERMHLLVFLQIMNPGVLFRLAVLGGQGVFLSLFMACYLISPLSCHRFVGYLEEYAIVTYTECLEEMKVPNAPIADWVKTPAPDIAMKYWRLRPGSTIYDVVLAVRADEANHRHVNHTLASISPHDPNPFGKDEHKIDPAKSPFGST